MDDQQDITEQPQNRRPSDRSPGLMSRRHFVALAGSSGIGLALAGLTGCSPNLGPVSELDGSSHEIGPLGAEPAAYTPPTPAQQPATGTPMASVIADVCVVGGGAAGMSAASVAAAMGARTVLIEESYVLGGNVTRGLVSLDRAAWGGDLMVAGWFSALINRLADRGDAIFPGPRTSFTTPCNPDALRGTALSMARESGVEVRLGTKLVWANVQDRRIVSITALEHGLAVNIEASVFVDCTGEGNLGYAAGNGYWLGDRETGITQGQTLIFCVAPVDIDQLWSYAQAEGSQVEAYRIVGLRHFMSDLRSSGAVAGSAQGGMLIDRHLWPDMVSISASETYGNHLEPGRLAQITAELEAQDYQIHSALKDRVPGFADSRVVRLAERPYLREGRRLVGYHELSATDIEGAVKPPDSIARGYYPIDLHNPGGGGAVQTVYLAAGDWYGIPYRCLVARDVDNLLMAGRCISVTHEALGSTRISPVSIALGHAAGVAAALSSNRSVRPADLPGSDVRRELDQQGALT